MTDAIQGGAALDAAVAVALGWTVRDEFYPSDGEYAGQLVYDPTGDCRGGPGEGWSPSTRIEQAWVVVEAMRAGYEDSDGDRVPGYEFELKWENEVWECWFPHWAFDAGHAVASTAPLAICRAALSALTPDQEPST